MENVEKIELKEIDKVLISRSFMLDKYLISIEVINNSSPAIGSRKYSGIANSFDKLPLTIMKILLMQTSS